MRQPEESDNQVARLSIARLSVRCSKSHLRPEGSASAAAAREFMGWGSGRRQQSRMRRAARHSPPPAGRWARASRRTARPRSSAGRRGRACGPVACRRPRPLLLGMTEGSRGKLSEPTLRGSDSPGGVRSLSLTVVPVAGHLHAAPQRGAYGLDRRNQIVHECLRQRRRGVATAAIVIL